MQHRTSQQIQTNNQNDNSGWLKQGWKDGLDIFKLVGGIVTFAICVHTFWYEGDIKDHKAKELMSDYGKAYEYALKYKKDNNIFREEKDPDKRKKGMEKFKDILSEDLYEEVENHIFGLEKNESGEEKNAYDTENWDYTNFVYIYDDENGNCNIEIKNKSIVVKKPYIIKETKDGKSKKAFYIDTRTYEVSRKKLKFWEYELKSYVKHMEDVDKDILQTN